MKKDSKWDFMRSEYDFSSGVRGKHHEAYIQGKDVVLPEPDVAEDLNPEEIAESSVPEFSAFVGRLEGERQSAD